MNRSAEARRRLRWLAVLAAAVAAAALAATANAGAPRGSGPPTPPSAPGVFFAKYKVSGYGVYHRTTYWDYKAAPCETGGKGGGTDGLLRFDGTLHWETVKPGLATITRFPGAPPGMQLGVAPGAEEPGIVATVSVAYTFTDNREEVSCHLDGSEERLASPGDYVCGSHTYKSGYLALPVWPHAGTKPGEHFGFGIRRLPGIESKVQKDWSKCGPAAFEYQDADFVNGALPFSNLPKRAHGRLTAIARGGETVIDSTSPQNGIAGSSVHDYDAYHATDYITLVRAG